MAQVKLRLKPRHRKWFSQYSTTRCIVSTALRETYGGNWKVGYGTARRGGFFSGTTLKMGLSAGEAAWQHDRGVNVAGRTVTLYGNPGPTLEERAAAKKKKAEERRVKAATARKAPAAKQPRTVAASTKRPAAAKPAASPKPSRWAMLWNPSAATQQADQQQPQPQKPRIYATPAAAERARREAGRVSSAGH